MDTKKGNVAHMVREERLKGGCRIKIHYFVNLDKKIVICKLMPYTIAYDGPVNKYIILTDNFFTECECDGIIFTGKATCLEEDSFNVDFGMKLAYDKAMFKLLASKKRFFNKIINCLQEEIEAINQEVKRVDKAYDQITRRFDAKMKEVTS